MLNKAFFLENQMRFCKKCECETERYACGQCKPCIKAYGAKNPEKVKASKARYCEANIDKEKARIAAYREANKDKIKAYGAARYKANLGKIKAANTEWRAKNPDKAKAGVAAWVKANPEAMRIIANNRRARKRAVGGKISKGLSAKLFKLQKGKCACCKQPLGEKYHLDHIMPLALGGSNTDDNIQLLRQRCNNQKHAKHPIDFMQERGFLL